MKPTTEQNRKWLLWPKRKCINIPVLYLQLYFIRKCYHALNTDLLNMLHNEILIAKCNQYKFHFECMSGRRSFNQDLLHWHDITCCTGNAVYLFGCVTLFRSDVLRRRWESSRTHQREIQNSSETAGRGDCSGSLSQQLSSSTTPGRPWQLFLLSYPALHSTPAGIKPLTHCTHTQNPHIPVP